MKTKVILFSFLMAFCLINFSTIKACTGLRLIASDKGVVVGRTMEFGINPQSDVLVTPAGSKISSSLSTKAHGIEYTSKYGIVGANGFGLDVHVDGLNEAGLYVGAFYFPSYASYNQPDPKKYEVSMAAEDYGTWLLANFKSIEEVKANFNKVFLVENPSKDIGNISFPLHYVIHDKHGNCVVIEPLHQSLVLYDNPLGVFTNSPTFDWHLTNVSNYINLSAINVEQVDLSGQSFKSFGEGSGLHGIPGDGTPPSRFIRATVYSQSAVKSETAEATVPQVFHLMNNFDIPVGSVRAEVQSSEGTKYINEITPWTTVTDCKNLTYSFKTFYGQQVCQIDIMSALKKAGKESRLIKMESEFKAKDVSTDFVSTDL